MKCFCKWFCMLLYKGLFRQNFFFNNRIYLSFIYLPNTCAFLNSQIRKSAFVFFNTSSDSSFGCNTDLLLYVIVAIVTQNIP